MRIVSGAATDTGRVRDGNEDSYLVDRRLKLFAVADGMGGHRAGEVASATALEGLRVAVDAGSTMSDAVGRANSAVWDQAAADTELAGMGTTLTAAWSDGTTLTVAHVGDSRAYLLRGETLQRVTVDHSLVEELIRDGRLTEEQAAVHPQRSIITRALGIDSSVAVDVYSLVLQPNDRVMICSDGLTSMVRAGGITEILRREPDPTAAANALVDAANEAGGEDNITVVILDAIADGKDPLPSSVAAAITGTPGTGPASSGDDAPTEVVEPVVVSVMTTSTSLDAPAVRQRRRPALRSTGSPRATPRATASPPDPGGSVAAPDAGSGESCSSRFRYCSSSASRSARSVGTPRTPTSWRSRARTWCSTAVAPAGCCSGIPRWCASPSSSAADSPRSRSSTSRRRRTSRISPPPNSSSRAPAATLPRRTCDAADHHLDHHLDHYLDHPVGQPVPAERSTDAPRAARRTRELSLGALALLVTAGGYVLLAFSKAPNLPPKLWGFLGAIVALFVCAHLAVRRFAPRADPTLLPIAALLLGIGFVTISRLDLHPTKDNPAVASAQSVWIAVGIGAFVITLFLVRHVRSLARYRYTFLLLGVGALLLPLVPGLGAEINRRAAVGPCRRTHLPAR